MKTEFTPAMRCAMGAIVACWLNVKEWNPRERIKDAENMLRFEEHANTWGYEIEPIATSDSSGDCSLVYQIETSTQVDTHAFLNAVASDDTQVAWVKIPADWELDDFTGMHRNVDDFDYRDDDDED